MSEQPKPTDSNSAADSRYFTSAEEILSLNDLREEDVYVPSWGKTVRIREMSSAEQDWFQASLISDAQSGKLTVKVETGRTGGDAETDIGAEYFRAKMVALSVINPFTGKRLFTVDQIVQLASKSSAAINCIADAVTKLNRMSKKEIDEIKNDLGRTQSDDSGSASPEPSVVPSQNSEEDSALGS